MPCCEISVCTQMSKTIIAVRHFGLGGRESLETAVSFDLATCIWYDNFWYVFHMKLPGIPPMCARSELSIYNSSTLPTACFCQFLLQPTHGFVYHTELVSYYNVVYVKNGAIRTRFILI